MKKLRLKNIPINKGHFFDLEPQHRLDAFKEKISKVGKKNTQNIFSLE